MTLHYTRLRHTYNYTATYNYTTLLRTWTTLHYTTLHHTTLHYKYNYNYTTNR